MSLRNVWQQAKLIVSYCNWGGIRHIHTTIFRSSRNIAITNVPPPRNPRHLFVPPAAKKRPTMPSNIFTDSDVVKSNIAIRNHLRDRQFDAALRLFNSMPRKSPITYSTMISGCFSNGKFKLAQQLFDKMSVKNLITCNIMIRGYIKNKDLGAALQLFDEMPEKNVVSWSTILYGYVQNGFLDEAKRVFDEMPEKNVVSWTTILYGYVQNGFLDEAKRVFDDMPEKNVVSWSTILSGYAQNGFLDEAKRIFDEMPVKNVVSWTAMVSGYAQNGFVDEARRVFDEMPEKNVVSWNTILNGYVQNGFMDEARRVFDEMPEKNVISWNTILRGYMQNGFMDEAKKVFDEMPVKDVVSWTTIVSGYAQNGLLDEAKRIFDEMPVKNVVSWNAMLSGYAQNGFPDEARRVFDEMPMKDVISWNAMITGYAQNGAIAKARDLFDRMPLRNCFTWEAIIGGYSKNGDSEEALWIFVEATRDRGRLSMAALASALSSCADITATELGKQIHGRIAKGGVKFCCYVGNALVSMYCRCGSINEAYEVFKRIENKNVISWTTIIVGFARHGFGQEALQHFESMKQLSIQPNEVTMVGVLTACSHTGLVDKAKHYFYSMTQDHGIVANLKHYNCLIDLLGRAGLLDEAQNLMKTMPFEPDAATWGALLGASRIHGDIELGEKAAEMISALEPWNSGMYVILSNIYAASGRWKDAKMMRVRMRDLGVGKTPGYSWVEVPEMVHTFCAGDFTHPESEGIRALLDELDLRMREDGYVPATKFVLHDVEEEEKQHSLRYHSERLAVAYGIMKIPRGRPIRVFKNLRVCEDCHDAIKHIARITGRLIVLRDANRFHHFEGGVCNCGDYW